MCQPTFCEMQSTGAEPVKGFDNGKSMPRMEVKFRTASETNLFLSKRFKIGITNITLHEEMIVKLSQERNETKGCEGSQCWSKQPLQALG